MKKLWNVLKKGLGQFSDSLDALNESINTSREAEKFNKNFLSGLDSFIDSLNRAVDTAAYTNEINKFRKVSSDHTEFFDNYLTEKKLAVDEKIKLVRLQPVFVNPDVRKSSLALSQRKEKIHDCLALINKIERDVFGNDTLIKILEQETDQSSFINYVILQKGILAGMLQAHSQDNVNDSLDIPQQSSDKKITVSWPLNSNKEPLRLFAGKDRAHHLNEHKSVSDAEIRKQKIKAFVAMRNIEALVHFTRIENIPSIIEKGLVGRSLLELNKVDTLINDNLRLDNINDAVSTSISFPNYRMFFSLQKQNSTADWAVIKINPSILWELDCAFCYSNAAGRANRTVPLDRRRSPESFEKMFDENIADVTRQRLNIPDNYTTDPQAEVLVLEAVDPKYILSISLNEKVKINNFPKVASVINPYLKTVNFVHEPLMFSPRRDYQHWAVQDEILKSNQENPYLRDFKF